MGDPGAPPLDARLLLETLARHGVDYIIVGGFAAVVFGSNRVTFDIDIVPSLEETNLERLVGALTELNAELRIDGEMVSYPVDVASLRQFEVSTWRTDAGDIDIIRGIPSGRRGILKHYDTLSDHQHVVSAFGISLKIADLDDIIESKEALGRIPDLEALPGLRRLRDTLARDAVPDEGRDSG